MILLNGWEEEERREKSMEWIEVRVRELVLETPILDRNISINQLDSILSIKLDEFMEANKPITNELLCNWD